MDICTLSWRYLGGLGLEAGHCAIEVQNRLTVPVGLRRAGEHLPEGGRHKGGGAGAKLPQPPSPALLHGKYKIEDRCQEIKQLEAQLGTNSPGGATIRPARRKTVYL